MNRIKKAFDKLSIPTRKVLGHLPQVPWSSVFYELDPRLIRVFPPRSEMRVVSREEDRQLVRFGPRHEFWLPVVCELNEILWGEYLSVFWDHLVNRHYYFRNHRRFSPESVVLDCGAFCGFFIRLAMEHGAGRVIAVEPNPAMRECLVATFSNEVASGKVVLQHAALTQTSCSLHYDDAESAPFGSTIASNGVHGPTIKGVCLDELLIGLGLTRLDFLKMDIEGFEIQALIGAADALQRFRPRLSVTTYHRCADFQMIRIWLRTIGYEHIRSSGLCRREKDTPSDLRPVMIYAWA
jgi:FkbM family methyltransferase